MSFLNPWGLLGLLTMPLIIGLHLHLERNRRLVVSSMYLWTFLDAKFQGAKPKIIRVTWLLILDLLLAAIFSLAFAQPQIRLPGLWSRDVHVVVLLDDSSSMLTLEGKGTRFSTAQEQVFELLADVHGETNSTVFTIGGRATEVSGTRTDSKAQIRSDVRDLNAGASGLDLRGGLALALALSGDQEVEVHIFTDGASPYQEVGDFPARIVWHFIGGEIDNQAILSPSLEMGGESHAELFIQLANFGLISVEREVVVNVDGVEVHREAVTLPAQSVQPFILPISGVNNIIEVLLTGSDSLAEDDRANLSNIDLSLVKVLLVTDQPEPLNRAIQAVPGTELSIVSPTEYLPGGDFDLVLFRDALPESWPDGVVAVFDPPTSGLVDVGGAQPVNGVVSISKDQILEGVNFSGVRWEIARKVNNWQASYNALAKVGDMPLLLRSELPRGELFVFTPVLSTGNLTRHPAFPVLVSNLVNAARGYVPDGIISLGETLKLPENEMFTEIVLEKPDGERQDLFGQSRQIVLKQTGIYTLALRDIFDEEQSYSFGVNAGDAEESNIAPQTWRDTVNITADTEDREAISLDVDLTPWLLFVGAILLVAEAWRAWR